MKKGFIYGGILVLMGFMAITISFILGGNDVFNIRPDLTQQTYTFDGKYEEITFEDTSSNFVVKASPDDKIHLKVYENDEQYFKVKEDKNLDIKAYDERKFQFFSLDFSSFEFKANELYLPKSMMAKLDIDNRNGAINIEDLDLKSLSASCNNGKITVSNLTVHEDMSIDSDNAAISIKRVKAKTINVMNNNGRIDLDKVESGNLKMESNNGVMEIKDLSSDNIKLLINNGQISFDKIAVKSLIDINSDNGKVEGLLSGKESDYSFVLRTKNGKRYLNGRELEDTNLGNGKQQVHIENKNGKIDLNTEN